MQRDTKLEVIKSITGKYWWVVGEDKTKPLAVRDTKWEAEAKAYSLQCIIKNAA